MNYVNRLECYSYKNLIGKLINHVSKQDSLEMILKVHYSWKNAPDDLKGPDAQPQVENNDEIYTPIIPQRTPDLLPQSQYRHETPAPPTTPDDNNENVNEYRPPYETEDGNPVFR